MSADIVVPVGEYLGALPFHDDGPTESANPQIVDAHMLAGSLLRLDDTQAEIMAYCRQLRLRSEVDDWLHDNQISPAALGDLFDTGLLRSGSEAETVRWLSDCVVVPWGRSLGWNEALTLLAPSDEAFQVSPVYYWLWLYSRTGRSIMDVLDFLRNEAAIPDVDTVSIEEASAAITHLLAVGLGRLELPALPHSNG